ncbi:hypothetical protein BMAA0967 [Burkholderia mallei ATCC 23344]|uniref:Uncharacterized protein n=2 Tax=Burkholderia mallei TaxID=13373 RepID=A0AAX1XC62_BURML|nr:hypothetical protein BMAA0967 [Burkholderia mallei ATCC 23344]RKO04477.1 hypothetical protein D8O03_08330 [Burkholderia mallei]RKO06766.1 hypothetical protein D8O05_07660 [Burkholderia mallei]RPA11373.1 hypothetical protein EGT58_005850 [Burkholderia mallei]RPA21038.1 hypothetical protein EGT61_005635 [Burkholderia mallei]
MTGDARRHVAGRTVRRSCRRVPASRERGGGRHARAWRATACAARATRSSRAVLLIRTAWRRGAPLGGAKPPRRQAVKPSSRQVVRSSGRRVVGAASRHIVESLHRSAATLPDQAAKPLSR